MDQRTFLHNVKKSWKFMLGLAGVTGLYTLYFTKIHLKKHVFGEDGKTFVMIKFR